MPRTEKYVINWQSNPRLRYCSIHAMAREFLSTQIRLFMWNHSIQVILFSPSAQGYRGAKMSIAVTYGAGKQLQVASLGIKVPAVDLLWPWWFHSDLHLALSRCRTAKTHVGSPKLRRSTGYGNRLCCHLQSIPWPSPLLKPLSSTLFCPFPT